MDAQGVGIHERAGKGRAAQSCVYSLAPIAGCVSTGHMFKPVPVYSTDDIPRASSGAHSNQIPGNCYEEA